MRASSTRKKLFGTDEALNFGGIVMYCPECGSKLIILADGTFEAVPDERLFKQLIEKSEQWKRAWEETLKRDFKRLSVEFVICGKCMRLFMVYGERGYYFDILGRLTNDAVARLVADKLKE